MAERSEQTDEWTHTTFGVHPATYKMPLLLDPASLAAMVEARGWVETYLATNRLGPAPGIDPATALTFGAKVTKPDDIVKTTLAAAKRADLQAGERARQQIDGRMVRDAMGQALKTQALDDAPAAAPAEKDDNGTEATLEVTNKDVQTNIQVTIKLRAQGDDDPRRVVILPDVEITIHAGQDATSSSIEAQLNLIRIKQDVSKHLTFNGHVIVQSIEFKTGISAEAGMSDIALAQIQKSLEVKLKSELEFKVNKAFSFSVEAEAGQTGVVVGPKLIFHF